MDDLAAKVVPDGQVEGAERAAALAGQAPRLLLGLVHRLAHRVLHSVLRSRKEHMRLDYSPPSANEMFEPC